MNGQCFELGIVMGLVSARADFLHKSVSGSNSMHGIFCMKSQSGTCAIETEFHMLRFEW